MLLCHLWCFILLTSQADLFATGSPIDVNHHDPPHQLIYQFPNETWVENLAVRAHNSILATLITSPEVWEVDPTRGTAEMVATFPNASSALGITEIGPDVFAVVLGAWSIETFQSTPGSYSVWKLDYATSKNGPKTEKIADIPSAGFLNGITPLPTRDHTVLISDSYRGVIYSLNTKIGAHKVVIDAPELKPKSGAVAKLGVNGIHYRQGYLYFTNSFNAPVLGRFKLNSDGTAAGAAETIVSKPTYPTNAGYAADDFTFDNAGNIWLAADASNTLLKVELPRADVTVVAGGIRDPLIAGDTAAAFGRTKQYERVLYVTTNGGLAYPAPGGVVGGKIVAFELHGLADLDKTIP